MAIVVPDIQVEVAFIDNAFVDTAAASSPTWTDITSYVMEVDCERGFQYERGQTEPGVATLQLYNADRRFDPSYSGSPYAPYVRPYRSIRISCPGYGSEPLAVGQDAVWTGYVERWPLSWDGPVAGFATITCVDLLAMLGRVQIANSFSVAAGTNVFPEQLTGERIQAVVEAVTDILGVTVSTLLINTSYFMDGNSTMAARTFAEGDDTTALAHIQEALATEGSGSAFYAGKNGGLVFIDRYSTRIFQGMNGYVVPTFTDGTLGANRYPYHDLQPSYDVDRLVNEVTASAGTVSWTAQDEDSIDRYWLRSMSVETQFSTASPDLIENLDDLANWELVRRKEPQIRFEQLVLTPTSEENWQALLKLDVTDEAIVERTYPTISQTEDLIRETQVERIHHSIRGKNDWTTTLGLNPDFSVHAEEPVWFVLDTSTLGDEAEFPSTGLLDNFNRPDEGPPMTGWTTWTTAGLTVNTNQCAPSGTGFRDAYWSTAMEPDVEAFVDIAVQATAGNSSYVLARLDTAAGNGYVLSVGEAAPDSWALMRYTGFAGTNLASGTQELPDGDAIGIRCLGSKIEGWARVSGVWSLLGSATDTTYDGSGPNNKIALSTFNNADTIVRYDNFGGGVYVPSALTTSGSELKLGGPLLGF